MISKVNSKWTSLFIVSFWVGCAYTSSASSSVAINRVQYTKGIIGPDWSDLTDAEKSLALESPWKALKVLSISKQVLQSTASLGGRLNGIGDAVRHTMWSALMVEMTDFDFAKAWGEAHEDFASNPALEKEMDLFNNSMGLEIGKTLKGEEASSEIFEYRVFEYARTGKLKVIDSKAGSSLIYSDRPAQQLYSDRPTQQLYSDRPSQHILDDYGSGRDDRGKLYQDRPSQRVQSFFNLNNFWSFWKSEGNEERWKYKK